MLMFSSRNLHLSLHSTQEGHAFCEVFLEPFNKLVFDNVLQKKRFNVVQVAGCIGKISTDNLAFRRVKSLW